MNAPSTARFGDPRKSDLWYDDRTEARRLVEAGFLPIEAQYLYPGDDVAYSVTMFGFPLDPEAPPQFGRVERVLIDVDAGEVRVTHSGGTTEADESTEVWARAAR